MPRRLRGGYNEELIGFKCLEAFQHRLVECVMIRFMTVATAQRFQGVVIEQPSDRRLM